MPFPLIGALALLGRIVGLGLERPWVKALAQGRNSFAATTLTFGIELLILLPLALYAVFHDAAGMAALPRWIGYALASGLLYALAFHSYVHALSVGEVSYLTPLYATAFIWLYALDVLFGQAVFGLQPLAGILAVTLGIVFLNHAPGRSAWLALHPLTMLRRPGAWGMLTYAFCLATGRIIDSQAMELAPVSVYALATNTPAVLLGLAWLLARRQLPQLVQLARERPALAVGSGVVGMGAYLLLLVALKQGIAPSVAEPVSQLSVFISIWLGGVMFGEAVQARWLPAALVVVGAALLVA